MENELTIKILSNSSGEEVDLENISIDAAESLKIFIESLNEFAKSYDYNSDVKLSIRNGSIQTSLIFPAEKEEISEDINEIVNGKSFEKHRTKLFKNIQDRIKMNGLEYSVLFKNDNQEYDLTPKFKSSDFPLRHGRRKPYKYEIEFLNGELFEAGGKTTTNIHVDINNQEYKITCERGQAKEINRRLYSKVYLSVLKRCREERKIEYFLIDNYLEIEKYEYFKTLHEAFESKDILGRYKLLHDKVVEIIEDDNINNNDLIKFLRLYNNSYSDRGIIRTLLMSIKPILDDNEDIVYYYNEVAKRFRTGNKLNKI